MDTNSETDLAPLRAKAQSGVSWFYWIAALSIVNSIVAATGSTWGFMAGLGATQLIDGLAMAMGPGAKPVALVLDVTVAALLVGLGVWASKNATVYLVGMIAYALDAVIFALVGDWVGLGFHGLVLFFLGGGWMAQRELEKRGARMPAATDAEPSIERAA